MCKYAIRSIEKIASVDLELYRGNRLHENFFNLRSSLARGFFFFLDLVLSFIGDVP